MNGSRNNQEKSVLCFNVAWGGDREGKKEKEATMFNILHAFLN